MSNETKPSQADEASGVTGEAAADGTPSQSAVSAADMAATDDANPKEDVMPGAELMHGRTRTTLPPHTPDPAEARAARPDPEAEPAPPTYAEMAHLLPR
jgi:hypothetical protein